MPDPFKGYRRILSFKTISVTFPLNNFDELSVQKGFCELSF